MDEKKQFFCYFSEFTVHSKHLSLSTFVDYRNLYHFPLHISTESSNVTSVNRWRREDRGPLL